MISPPSVGNPDDHPDADGASLQRAMEILEGITGRADRAQAEKLATVLAERDRLARVAGRVARLGGWTIDLAAGAVHWSDEVCAIHDAPPGTTVTLDEGIELFAPESRPVIREHVRRCATEGVPYDLELEKLTLTGRRIWVRTIGEPVRSVDGAITHIQGAFQDITAQRQARARQLENEAILREITDNMREIFWTFTPDFSRAIYVSPAYAEIWGRPVKNLYENPDSFLSAVHEEDRDALVAAMVAVRDGAVQDVEYRVVWPDGQVRWVSSRGYPVYDDEGRLYRVVGTTADITDRRRAEAERAAAEAEYRHLFETAPYGIYALDAEGNFTQLNPAAERLLERPAAELMGRHFSTVIAPEDLAVAQDGFDRVISGAENDIEFDERIVQASGAERLIRVTESAVWDGDRIVGTHGIARDITDDAEREKSLRRAERLASVGTLLSGVAHELNNPLHAIGNFAELMLLEERAANDREALEIIRREAARAARVVSDLRLFARDTQEERQAGGAVDLNEVVRHIVKVRRYSLETSNVQIREDLAPGLPPVHGDRGQLEQVLLNLVVNAEQAMAGQTRLRRLILRTRNTSDGVALHVVDSGAGIPKEALERIFDPFFTTKPPGDGTGLGLALVHSMVTEHGGQISVESEVGSGTAFRVDLPRATVHEPAPVSSSEAPGPSSGRRVLVVDDEAAIRRVVSRFLTRRGYEVVEAADGGAALRLLRSGDFDVILSDLRMPGLGGDELLRRLRAEGGGLERRLVFVTGDVDWTPSGADDDGPEIPVLVKPVSLASLARAIEAVVSKNGG